MTTATVKSRRVRSPRHIRAAARLLQKEARRILKRHSDRIAKEPVDAIRASSAAIDSHRAQDDVEALEVEAERLDELLHQHASFARKSAIRETLENIGVAVLIALGLRSCLYEPFQIPSGSMMPTLRAGDHIFVNKFVYGIQIPFTTTVIGESFGEIERGDIIVFRYPLDESEDYIKRVIGLPGDEIKVSGRQVWIRRAGEPRYEQLEHTPVEQPCFDDTGEVLIGCQLYEERMGDRTYVVRYLDSGPRLEAGPFKVPEEGVLVMGDNRNQSADSLQWTVSVEAVNADKLLTLKDLRDLTVDKLFEMNRPDEVELERDPKHDHVIYSGAHRSLQHDVALAVWRDPVLGVDAVYEAAVSELAAPNERSLESLLGGRVDKGAAAPTLEAGRQIDRLTVGTTDEGYRAVALVGPQIVLALSCGRKVCTDQARLAQMLADVVLKATANPELDARALLERPTLIRYNAHWSGRTDPRDHYVERRFTKPGATGPAATVRLRAFRKPSQGIDFVRNAALEAAGGADKAQSMDLLGADAWLVEGSDAFRFVAADHDQQIAFLLECGKDHCARRSDLTKLVEAIEERIPTAASDRRRLAALLRPDDVPGWKLEKLAALPRDPYDRVQYEATVSSEAYTAELEAWFQPEAGLEATVAAARTEHPDYAPDDSVAPGGYIAATDDGFRYLFAVPETSTVLAFTCNVGLCPSKDKALALARRVASKALDATTFVDPDFGDPRPFVPRGNVKGRAERIWLPFSRFWLPIR